MQIQVSGRKIDVGAALSTYMTGQIEMIADKYFNRSIEAHVTVGRNGPFFSVDCSLHVRNGIHMQSHAEAADAHAAFDLAADKLEKQLRRHKRRLKDRHASGRAGQEEEEALIAQAYILAPEEGAGDEEAAVGDETEDQPVIIAETRTEIPHVSVGDAVMLMDLSNAPALMFRNRRNGRMNVVYRRTDGNIGWVDPAKAEVGSA